MHDGEFLQAVSGCGNLFGVEWEIPILTSNLKPLDIHAKEFRNLGKKHVKLVQYLSGRYQPFLAACKMKILCDQVQIPHLSIPAEYEIVQNPLKKNRYFVDLELKTPFPSSDLGRTYKDLSEMVKIADEYLKIKDFTLSALGSLPRECTPPRIISGCTSQIHVGYVSSDIAKLAKKNGEAILKVDTSKEAVVKMRHNMLSMSNALHEWSPLFIGIASNSIDSLVPSKYTDFRLYLTSSSDLQEFGNDLESIVNDINTPSDTPSKTGSPIEYEQIRNRIEKNAIEVRGLDSTPSPSNQILLAGLVASVARKTLDECVKERENNFLYDDITNVSKQLIDSSLALRLALIQHNRRMACLDGPSSEFLVPNENIEKIVQVVSTPLQIKMGNEGTLLPFLMEMGAVDRVSFADMLRDLYETKCIREELRKLNAPQFVFDSIEKVIGKPACSSYKQREILQSDGYRELIYKFNDTIFHHTPLMGDKNE